MTCGCHGTVNAPTVVTFCPLHAAAEEMRALITAMESALLDLSENAGDIAYWNRGGHGYVVTQQARALLARTATS